MPTKTDYILILLGGLGAVLLTSNIPTFVATMNMSPDTSIKSTGGCSKCSDVTLDKISGIDINALNICRQNDLM